MVEPEEVEMLVSLPNLALGNKMQGSASFRVLEKKIQMAQLCDKKPYSNILWQPKITTKFDRMRTMDVEQLLFCAENIRVLRPVRKLEFWQVLPQEQSSDQFMEVHIVKFMTVMR